MVVASRHFRYILLSAAACLLNPPQGYADDVKELQDRLDKLERKHDQLLRLLHDKERSSTDGNDDKTDSKGPMLLAPIPLDAVEKGESSDQIDAKAPSVGENLDIKARWTKGDPKGSGSSSQLWFETEDKFFRIHFGGLFHFDAIWVNAADHVQFGKGGIGKFDNATNFRRVRLGSDGWIYDIFDFNCYLDFVQTVNDDPLLPPNAATNVVPIPALTDMWASINYIPCVGTFRIGNMKPPILLEHMTSSRFLDFLWSVLRSLTPITIEMAAINQASNSPTGPTMSA